MRNEIFACHGRAFKDAELRKYFNNQSWYSADPNYSDSRLTSTEKRNADFINNYQKRNNLYD